MGKDSSWMIGVNDRLLHYSRVTQHCYSHGTPCRMAVSYSPVCCHRRHHRVGWGVRVHTLLIRHRREHQLDSCGHTSVERCRDVGCHEYSRCSGWCFRRECFQALRGVGQPRGRDLRHFHHFEGNTSLDWRSVRRTRGQSPSFPNWPGRVRECRRWSSRMNWRGCTRLGWWR